MRKFKSEKVALTYLDLYMTQHTVLVTGGNRGIGLALCKHFAKDGKRFIRDFAKLSL